MEQTLPAPAEPTIRIEPSADEEVNERINRYKILQKLGEGGCGVVYMAEQTEPVRRRVALKVIKLGMDTKQVIARFEAERQALALMDHPNIAKVLDAGTTEKGRPYFVMELVKGIRITDYCDQNHLTTPQRLGLFTQVCHAIQHAHQKGIIHRDIKPSNILVTLHDGVPVPKVIDFGIAKATEQALTEKTVFTAFGQFMGTPAYMSPEQAELSGLDIDTRSDIYALGVLLYELLTGKTPFDAKELLQAGLDEMRRRIREDEPMRPSTRLSTMADADLTETAQRRHADPAKLTRFIRGDLDWIVMKCLEKDRTRRYETANGLAADIKRHLTNEPVVACPPSAAYRFQKLIRRNKLGFAAVTAVAAALVIGLGIAAWQYFEKSKAYDRAVLAERQAQENARSEEVQRKRAEKLAEENRINLYAADIKLIDVAIKEGNVNHALTMLARWVPKATEPDLRSFDWQYLSQLCRLERFSFQAAKIMFAVAFSPDGRWVADADPAIRLWDAATGKLHMTLNGHNSGVGGLVFSPDGKILASVSDDKTLRLWDVSGGKLTRMIEETNPLARVAFSPDGSVLAVGEGYGGTQGGSRTGMYAPPAPSGRVTLWDTRSWQSRQMLAGHRNGVRSLAFSPNGQKLASGGIDGRVLLHDVPSGRLLAAQTNFPGAIGGVVFSADGNELAVASWAEDSLSGRIKFLDGDNMQEKRSINDEVGQVLCMVRSPDGTTLVSAGLDRITKFWDFASGRLLTRFQGHERAVVALAYSPDGKSLATTGWDRTTKIWNAQDNLALRKVQTENSLRVAFSPDGRFLACADEGLELRDAETSEVIRALPEFPPGGLVAFSPQGDVLAAVGMDASIHFWDTQSWRHWMPIKKDSDQTTSPQPTYWPDCRFKFTADGRMLVVPGFDGVIRFFEPKTARLLDSIDGGSFKIDSVALTADAKTLFTANHERLDVWDVPAKRIIATFKERGQLLQISKDQRWLASGSFEQGIKLRDLSTLAVRATMVGHKETIYSIAFSHDSRLLASASWDGTVKIWHVLSGRELMTIFSPAPVESVAFAPDDRTLAFGTLSPELFLLRTSAEKQSTAPPIVGPSATPSVQSSDLGTAPAGPVKAVVAVALPPSPPKEQLRSMIPPRSPDCPPTLLNLSEFFTAPLTNFWIKPGNVNNDFAALPTGIQRWGEVDFDIRGIVQVSSSYASFGYAYPSEVTGIPVAQNCKALHFLHSAAWNTPDGTIIGYYLIRFDDDFQETIPIIYGMNMANWWDNVSAVVARADTTRIAWQGQNAASKQRSQNIRLFDFRWQNPRPEVKIRSIDFKSAMTQTAPFLLAITLE